ncbi:MULTISPECIES: hypothetical protein [unclassified Sphingomonas]|nr:MULTISPECIES: hypothetical protein [unclassified Sphingomonas]
MATSAPAPTPTPSQPPVEILYAVPVGTVISWYPSPTAFQTNPNDPSGPKLLVYPPGFRMCDGSTVNDPDSPFDGAVLPNLVNRFILGSGDNIAYGDTGGYGIGGWQNTGFATSPTAASSSDDVLNNIIQNQNPTTSWRYQLTKNDGLNDGNHHHTVAAGAFTVPPPGYLALIPIIRIK